MKRNNRRIVAFICALILLVTATLDIMPITVSAEGTISDITLNQAIGDYGTVESYQYRSAWLGNATSEYKYMIITYTGNIAPLRIEGQFKEGYTADGVIYWMDQSQNTTLKLVGVNPILNSESESTVIVDIEASGIDFDSIKGIHMHYGPGTLNIIDVKLTTTIPASLIKDIVLTDLVGTYGTDTNSEYVYKQEYFSGALSSQRYLLFSFIGNAKRCRLGFYNADGKIGTELWVDATQNTNLLSLVGNPELSSETETTLVVDLEATGINVEELTRIRVHNEKQPFEITDFRITTTIPANLIKDITLTNLVGVYGIDTSSGYAYKQISNIGAVAGQKYMIISYIGDIRRYRFSFYNSSEQIGTGWVDPSQSSSDLVLVGNNNVFKSQTGATVIVDLEASGIAVDELTKIIAHNNDRALEITDIKLTATLPEIPVEDITVVENYKTNNVSLAKATSDYKYMFFTYVGDISQLQIQGIKNKANVGDIYIMDQTQESCLLLVGENPILNSEEATTVIVDIEKSGIDLDAWDTMNLIYDSETLEIGNIRLSENEDTTDSDDFRYFSNKEPVENYTYSFAVVGDTQIVTLDDKNSNTNNLSKIYNWILDNKEEKNIQYVFGLGDIVETGEQAEWEIARQEISQMNGQIPYSIVRGNHDIPGLVFSTEDTTDYFTQYLGTEDYTSQFANGGFYEEDNIFNAWHTFSVGEVDYLMLALDYCPSDEVLAWASNVVENHPYHNVIVTTHAYLDSDGTQLLIESQYSDNDGEKIWNKFLSQHENIVLLMCGHVSSEKIVLSKEVGVNGNTVTSMLVNPQGVDKAEGVGGMVAMLYFSEDGKNVQVEYYSTVREKFFLSCNQFSFELPVIEKEEEETPTETTTAEEPSSEEPTTEKPTTVVPSTEKPTTVEFTTTTSNKVTPPKKTKVKLATKKSGAKKVKLSIKKVKGADGYQVQFSKKKKFSKKNILVTKIVKKAKVTVRNKKLKKAKKLYVRVKAYTFDGKKKVWSKKWSKVKKVIVRK